MSTLSPLLEKSRFNMIAQQIRPAGILDEKVLETLSTLSRDAFVDEQYQNIAYTDTEIPIVVEGIKTNETMLTPILEARLAEALQLAPSDTVLEIGTGSGFQAALLAQLCKHVTSVEVDPKIAQFAIANLQKNHITNVKVEIGDGQNGWGTTEFDAIVVTGSLPEISNTLKYKLAEGGRLVAVIGTGPSMSLVRVTRQSATDFTEEHLLETYIKPLNGPHISHFKF
ncbi:protein-L-isoaspartate O-methyltransferase family protein [Pelistega ratti]|uniref:protein-L-isoaspartate O-methyltransferase family protein n=1 Tax=Pelistega ratti TaxID=2652177 RepID=UPI0013584622|nr:protein-L-isoaspartate O-methyltransferase [Pelistega ratti]